MKYQERIDYSVILANDITEYLTNEGLSYGLSRISYEVLAMQIIESMKRVKYFNAVSNRDIDTRRLDPQDTIFDPVRAILYLKDRNYDEACWLTFLLVYTAENYQSNWNFLRQLYSGVDEKLTWEVASNNTQILPRLADNLINSQNKPKFGNHAKFKTLRDIPRVLEDYINFVKVNGGHYNLFINNSLEDPKEHFRMLFPVIRRNIHSFGRLSTFDYLSMLSKTGLVKVEADNCHIVGSTGPKDGAKLIFGSFSDKQLDSYAMGLADHLEIGYQEMEDALCNWQKSPNVFYTYKG